MKTLFNQHFQNRAALILMYLQYIVFITIILYFGKTLFIPLTFSLLISFILYPFCHFLETKGMSRGLASIIPVFGVITLFAGILYILLANLLEFSYEWTFIKAKILANLQDVSLFLAQKLHLSAEKQLLLLQDLAQNVGNKAFNALGATASSVSEGFFSMMIIPIFASLTLLYRTKLVNVLYLIFPSETRGSIQEILIQTIHTYYNFIKGMLMVYCIVGVLNSIGLAIVGIPHPILFGCIAAILTFIPYVGIMIASLLPITVAWVTYNTIWYPFAVVVVFAIVQLLEAYLIFPLSVGNRLKINTLVIFLMIILGGMLWGAAGMILFIPIVSILKLIADKSPKLKIIADFLGN